MSNEQAEKKKKEIENLTVEEEQIMQEMDKDNCPNCGKFTKTFDYVVLLPPPYGWVECPGCGTVFCPPSIRRQKLKTSNDIKLVKAV